MKEVSVSTSQHPAVCRSQGAAVRRCYTGSQLPLGKVWEYLALVSPHCAVGTECHWSRCLRLGGNFRPALNITHSLTSPAAQLAVIQDNLMLLTIWMNVVSSVDEIFLIFSPNIFKCLD